MKCDECGSELKTTFSDRERGFIWCRNCCLVYDPKNPMGKGISGLMSWLRMYGMDKSDMRKITEKYVIDGLRSARLAAVKIIPHDG